MRDGTSRAVSSRVPLAILSGFVLFGMAPAGRAQPSGGVTFTGPGAALLPSTTFVPSVYAGTESSWSFFSEAGDVGIVVTELTTDPSRASLVSVTVSDGPTWVQFSFSGVLGVSIDTDTIAFQDLVLPQSALAPHANLTVNGSLTRPVISVSDLSWGRVKDTFRDQ
jgi:hypothetical protein